MSSLRARQKKARREQMIEAARALFVAQGYGKTTIEAIAEEASVGVATVYTYFETKEGLAAALIKKDISDLLADAEALIPSLPPDPAEAIILILDIFKNFSRYISAELMREFVIQGKVAGPVSDVWMWGHQSQVATVAHVLRRAQDMGSASKTLEPELAAALIVDLLDRHVTRLTASGGAGDIAGQLAAFVRLLFQDWNVR